MAIFVKKTRLIQMFFFPIWKIVERKRAGFEPVRKPPTATTRQNDWI